jgi:Flp pilus assembly pilin Flp
VAVIFIQAMASGSAPPAQPDRKVRTQLRVRPQCGHAHDRRECDTRDEPLSPLRLRTYERIEKAIRRRGTAVATAAVSHKGAVACRDEGQDLLEYALLVALIALVAVGAVTAAGTSVSGIFNAIVAALPA